MNITFLLGNGFDIQCGLKTSYLDFYKHILRKKYSIEMNEDNVDIDEKLISKIDNIIYQEIYKFKDDIQTWADLEYQLGIFSIQLKRKGYGTKLANRLLDDFDILQIDLNNYLKEIQIQDDVKIDEDFSEVLFKTMDEFFNGVTDVQYDEIKKTLVENRDSNFVYRFISFNYTNSLQKILENCGHIKKSNIFNGVDLEQMIYNSVENVHGVIGKDLLLGLNDESQVATDFFEKNDLTELLKPETLANSGDYRRKNAEDFIDSSDLIVIFGMSIGSTDKHWWEKIADILLKNKNKKLIIHFYVKKQDGYISQRMKNESRKKNEEKFIFKLDNLKLSEEQDLQLRKQIYIVTNSQYITNVDLSKYLNQDKNKSNNIIDFEAKDVV